MKYRTHKTDSAKREWWLWGVVLLLTVGTFFALRTVIHSTVTIEPAALADVNED